MLKKTFTMNVRIIIKLTLELTTTIDKDNSDGQ